MAVAVSGQDLLAGWPPAPLSSPPAPSLPCSTLPVLARSTLSSPGPDCWLLVKAGPGLVEARDLQGHCVKVAVIFAALSLSWAISL